MSPIWGTIPQWLSAIAACVGVGIAFNASRSWQKSLREKRTDDLLMSVTELAAVLGSTRNAIKRRVSGKAYGAKIDELYQSANRLDKAFIVARRSYNLDMKIMAKAAVVMRSTTEQAKALSENAVLETEFENATTLFTNLTEEFNKLFAHITEVTK